LNINVLPAAKVDNLTFIFGAVTTNRLCRARSEGRQCFTWMSPASWGPSHTHPPFGPPVKVVEKRLWDPRRARISEERQPAWQASDKALSDLRLGGCQQRRKWADSSAMPLHGARSEVHCFDVFFWRKPRLLLPIQRSTEAGIDDYILHTHHGCVYVWGGQGQVQQ
jgi:hypothetical protein